MSPYTIPRAPSALPREAPLVTFIEKALEQHQEEHLGRPLPLESCQTFRIFETLANSRELRASNLFDSKKMLPKLNWRP